MGMMLYSFLWVMQDLCHQPSHWTSRLSEAVSRSTTRTVWSAAGRRCLSTRPSAAPWVFAIRGLGFGVYGITGVLYLEVHG